MSQCNIPTNTLNIINNCSGAIGIGNTLFNYWDTNNCPIAYSQGINNLNGTLKYNSVCQEVIQERVVNLFNTYLETNQITDNVTSSNYNNFQNTLLELCINPSLPGICGLFLGGQDGNSGYCSQFTRDQVINSPILTNFCGCYIPPDPDYLQYTLGSSGCQIGTGCTAGCAAGNEGCTGQPACDPLCHRAMTSQKANNDTGVIITCPQNICVIDNATIIAKQSNVPGGINFNTICGGCNGEDNSCLCVVSGTNITTTMSQIGIGTNFNQFCGTNSVCLVQDSFGNIISQGACTGIDPTNIGTSGIDYLPSIGIIIIIVIIFLLIIIIILVARYSRVTIDYPIRLE